jgi:hypothetical protein
VLSLRSRPGSEDKLYIFKLARRWYARCNHCLTQRRQVRIASSPSHRETLEWACGHARVYHGVVI